MGLCANVVCLISVMLQPYMPKVSQQIQEQLQVDTIETHLYLSPSFLYLFDFPLFSSPFPTSFLLYFIPPLML